MPDEKLLNDLIAGVEDPAVRAVVALGVSVVRNPTLGPADYAGAIRDGLDGILEGATHAAQAPQDS